ncbi:MAG: tetratricopeptide repeat protein [Steroidobacteraceae bacterium]
MKFLITAVLAGGLLAGCVLLSPPEPEGSANTSTGAQSQQREAAPPAAPAAQPNAPGGAPAPMAPGQQAPQQRTFMLGAAAGALVGVAHAQEQSRNFGLAAETLERALSIEPRNPLVWIELGRENILAGNPAQAYGMGRKAVYLASGDPRAQASAWELVAASLRAQGRNDEAYVAEEKAVRLSPRGD